MTKYYTNKDAADLLLAMTSIVEKPEDCDALCKCFNQAVENAVDDKDKEIYRLRMYQIKLRKRIVFLQPVACVLAPRVVAAPGNLAQQLDTLLRRGLLQQHAVGQRRLALRPAAPSQPVAAHVGHNPRFTAGRVKHMVASVNVHRRFFRFGLGDA